MIQVVSAPSLETDVIGPWSEQKLALLEKYLSAYTTIMKSQAGFRDGFHYIDGFAGTGKPRARDEQRYIDGSPRVALQQEHPFHSVTFIEKSPRRAERLRGLRAEFPDRRISVVEADCNVVIATRVAPWFKRQNRTARGLVFLDPFGMELEWTTIEAVANAGSLEILLNFPVMALNRAGPPNGQSRLNPGQIERMTRFWGSSDWRGELYAEVPTLFGTVEMKKHPTTGKRLGQLFQRRLNEVFPYVSEPLVMTNSMNGPLYCLIAASHYAVATKIVNDIFKRYERLGR